MKFFVRTLYLCFFFHVSLLFSHDVLPPYTLTIRPHKESVQIGLSYGDEVLDAVTVSVNPKTTLFSQAKIGAQRLDIKPNQKGTELTVVFDAPIQNHVVLKIAADGTTTLTDLVMYDDLVIETDGALECACAQGHGVNLVLKSASSLINSGSIDTTGALTCEVANGNFKNTKTGVLDAVTLHCLVPQGTFENESGIILADDDITIKAHAYQVHRSAVELKSTKKDFITYDDNEGANVKRSCTERCQHETAPPAILASRAGNVTIDVDAFMQTASVLVAQKNLSITAKKHIFNSADYLYHQRCALDEKHYYSQKVIYRIPREVLDYTYVPSLIVVGQDASFHLVGHKKDDVAVFDNSGVMLIHGALLFHADAKAQCVIGKADFSSTPKRVTTIASLFGKSKKHNDVLAAFHAVQQFDKQPQWRQQKDTMIHAGEVMITGLQTDVCACGNVGTTGRLFMDVASLVNGRSYIDRVYLPLNKKELKPDGILLGQYVDITTHDAGGLSNDGGTLMSGGEMHLHVIRGNLDNEVGLARKYSDWNPFGSGGRWQNSICALRPKESMCEPGLIVSLGGGDIRVDAGMIIDSASNIMSPADFTFTCRDNMIFNTLLSAHTVNHHNKLTTAPATLTIGGDLHAESKKGTFIAHGAKITVAGNAYFKCKKNIEIGTASMPMHWRKKIPGSWFFGLGSRDQRVTIDKIVQSEMNIGGELVLEAELDNVLEAVILHAGKAIHVIAGRDNIFKGKARHTDVVTEGYTFGMSFLGSEAIAKLAQGEGTQAIIALADEDPFIKALHGLAQVGNAPDAVAGVTYTGIEAARLLIARARNPQASKKAFMGQRLGVTDANGKFAPTLTFKFGYTRSHYHKKDFARSQLSALYVETISGRDDKFLDGTEVHAEQRRDEAKRKLVYEAAKETETRTETVYGAAVSAGPNGFTANVGETEIKDSKTEYKNVVIDAEQSAYKAPTMEINGATLKGNNDFDVDHMVIKSPQDKESHNMESFGASAGTDGSVGFDFASEDSEVTKTNRSGFEKGTQSGHIGRLDTTAGDFDADEDSTLMIDKVVGKPQRDETQESRDAVRLSTNPADFLLGLLDFAHKRYADHTDQHGFVSNNVKVGESYNIVRDASKKTSKTVVDEDTYWRFVIPIPNPKKCAEAMHDVHDMLWGKSMASPEEKKEAIDALKDEMGIDLDETFDAEDGVQEGQVDDQAEVPKASTEETPQAAPQQPTQEDTKPEQSNDDVTVTDVSDEDDDTDKFANEANDASYEHAQSQEVLPEGVAEDDTSGINLTSLKAELDDHQTIKIDIIEAFMPYRSTLPYDDSGKTEIVRNPQGDYTLMMGIGGGKGLHLTGSLAELTTYVSRWQAVTLNAPPVAYASMSDENPSIAIDWLKTACDKLVNIADWVLPIKESYSIAAGSDYDTGQRLTWTQRTLRGVTAVATAIVAVKVGRIAVKAGARVLGWVVETRAGKVVKKVVKRLAQPIADRLEKRAFNKLVKKAGLKYLGNEVWESPAGLLYTVDESGRFQNRIYHVLAHAEKDLSGKVTHTVFACPKDQILPLIDEAWSLRMTTNPIKQGERTVYNIAMERAIGTTGETNIKLVVEGNKLKTAFPTKGSA